jgi:type III pantothenate kinase
MHNLYIDIGNTRVKWAWGHAGQLHDHGAMTVNKQAVADCLPQILGKQPMDGIFIASVVSAQWREQIQQFLQRGAYPQPQWAQSESRCGKLISGYAQPQQLGVDRWLAMLAATTYQTGPLCVVSCGTAVTVDGIDADGQHQGGIILPGLRLMMDSLQQRTELIGQQARSAIHDHLADNTRDAVNAGCISAIAGAVRHTHAQLALKNDDKVICLLSGGDAKTIEPCLDGINVSVQPDLVLQGLALWGETKGKC